MTNLGHNGGPAIGADVNPDDIEMTWIRLHIGDFKKGVKDLSFELRGFYISILCEMYEESGKIPNDIVLLSRRLGTSTRTMRRVLEALMADGKVYAAGAYLRNKRCDEERERLIIEYCNRHAAAVKREQDKRDAAAQAAANASAQSATEGSLPEVSPKYSDCLPEVSSKLARNQRHEPHEFAGSLPETIPEKPIKTTTETPQFWSSSEHSSDQSRGEKQEARSKKQEKEEKTLPPPPVESAARPDLGGLSLRDGEEYVGHGVLVNCETIRHKDFTISLTGIEMQLLGVVPMREIKPIALGQALQWALDLESGKPKSKVVPDHPANFIRGSIQAQRNNAAVTGVRMAKAAPKPFKPSRYGQ